MITLVAALTLSLNLGEIVRPASPLAPAASCGIKTVSYRFVGTPGREFVYEGEKFTIPNTGSIELIAGRRTKSYQIDGRVIPLDLAPIGAFGSRTVEVPSASAR